jgi:FMN phosphatase YigB (HAD superfamily)
MQAVLFDLDDTLLDTSALGKLRNAGSATGEYAKVVELSQYNG